MIVWRVIEAGEPGWGARRALAWRAQVVVGVSSRSQEFSADDAQEFSPSTILLILREIRPRVLAWGRESPQ